MELDLIKTPRLRLVSDGENFSIISGPKPALSDRRDMMAGDLVRDVLGFPPRAERSTIAACRENTSRLCSGGDPIYSRGPQLFKRHVRQASPAPSRQRPPSADSSSVTRSMKASCRLLLALAR